MNIKHILLLLLGYLPVPVLALTLSQTPLGVNDGGKPLVLLNLERDHKLYYEAYNDASDLNPAQNDGLDIRYSPTNIDYFGYFDSYKCYKYDSSGKFTPVEKKTDVQKSARIKTCPNDSAAPWSGDFLNYLTMSRMDALRAVLYGGKRYTDSATATVLERAYIPQDAHSWGKEYNNVATDGYNIADYTPFSLPAIGRRHIFANTTLRCPTGNTDPGCSILPAESPLLRALTDTTYRVWEWLSIERPVAGVQCATGNNVRASCTNVTTWQIVPSSNFSGLKQQTWRKLGGSGSDCPGHPGNTTQFIAMETCVKKKDDDGYGTQNVSQINGNGNPFGDDDNYFTVFEGNLVVTAGEGGNYQFAVDGDDAVELYIDGFLVVGWYGGHGDCGGSTTCLDSHSATVSLSAGSHSIKFRHEEEAGGDNYFLRWQKPGAATASVAAAMTNYVVRVDACISKALKEDNCRGYPTEDAATPVYKPSGILQQHGEPDKMAFGLMTGSYSKNTSGGVLRKNISSIKDEINSATGQINLMSATTGGIIKSIDALKIKGFGTDYSYDENCGVPEVNGSLTEGRCRAWGYPTAEMMYEGLRYFAGKASPLSDFTYTSASSDDNSLGLVLPAWKDPYNKATGGYPSCSKPVQMVIGDINPNFDTDQLPGRQSWPTVTPADAAIPGSLGSLSVSAEATAIWNAESTEMGISTTRNVFIGQSESNTANKYDGAPTAKTVTTFADIRGLAPEEPTQRGGYYAASVARYGKYNDINPVVNKQNVDTYSVALASPLPHISFTLNGRIVTLVPFAKTVGGCGSINKNKGFYQPTNTIVDFYVDTLTDTTAKFRINYEDSEYGSDHDMDAIVEYELTKKPDNTLDVRLNSVYAAGGCIQHMGYSISGTSKDGVYLEVRDTDTGTDVDYFLDTPPGTSPQNDVFADNQPLPLDTTRPFTAGSTSASFIEHDPLWYAAKWGGFNDLNKDGKLDLNEWDISGGADTVPDTYFLVTNAGLLKEKLDKAISVLLSRENSGSAAAATSSTLDTTGRAYRAKFDNSDWSGQLLSYRLVGGILSDTPEWNAAVEINEQAKDDLRTIFTKGATVGIPFRFASLTGNTTSPPAAGTQQALLNKNAAGVTDNCGLERVAYLRGIRVNEGNPATTFKCSGATGATIERFRQRNVTVLGDIISSTPVFIGAPSAGYSDATDPGYSAFRSAKLNRKRVIYTGANDGMLHGFDASIDFSKSASGENIDGLSGREVLAYVPGSVISNLNKLTGQGYNGNHQFFVDDAPMTADVNFSSTATPAWRTALIGSLGAGGKGYFALDVTDPANFSEGNAASLLLWEFTQNNDNDMGFAFNRPPLNFANGQSKQIVKLKVNGETKWAAIVGNGYNSGSGKAVLYILYIAEGANGTLGVSGYQKIVADASATVGYDNGLSTPMPMDTNTDGFADTVYAGDLKGNMWKFSIGEVLVPDAATGKLVSKNGGVTDNPSTWKVAFSSAGCGDNVSAATKPVSTCVPLFKARNDANQIQPIFWPPELAFHPIQGQLVFFGTGKYIENADLSNNNIQSFYGIWDRDDNTTTVGSRSANLLKQNFSASACTDNQVKRTVTPVEDIACTFNGTGGTFRISTQRPITWRDPSISQTGSTHLGWYIDTVTDKERITGIPKLINSILFFNTLIPPDSDCSKPTGFLAALDYKTGGLLDQRVFNTNGNTKINKTDDNAASAYQNEANIGGTTIVKLQTDDSGTSGAIGSGTATDGTECDRYDPKCQPKKYCKDGSDGYAIGGESAERICLGKGIGRLSWREILPD